jgi:hypothetical protein
MEAAHAKLLRPGGTREDAEKPEAHLQLTCNSPSSLCVATCQAKEEASEETSSRRRDSFPLGCTLRCEKISLEHNKEEKEKKSSGETRLETSS